MLYKLAEPCPSELGYYRPQAEDGGPETWVRSRSRLVHAGAGAAAARGSILLSARADLLRGLVAGPLPQRAQREFAGVFLDGEALQANVVIQVLRVVHLRATSVQATRRSCDDQFLCTTTDSQIKSMQC